MIDAIRTITGWLFGLLDFLAGTLPAAVSVPLTLLVVAVVVAIVIARRESTRAQLRSDALRERQAPRTRS